MNKRGSEVLMGNLIKFIIIAVFIVVMGAIMLIYGPLLIEKISFFENIF
jgi:ABC-type bacteriocin/lantibiotic exporter with double-glycine peptidase domain